MPWFLRLLRRMRPREGWLTLFLTWLAAVSLPGAAVEAGIVPGLGPTLSLASLGLLAGWWLGHRRLRGCYAAVLAFAGGVVADLAVGVYVFDPFPLVAQAGRWLSWWLACGAAATCRIAAPPLTYPVDQWTRLASFGQRVGWWTNGLITGQGVADNLVLVGLAGLLAWLLAAWAGWWVARRGRAFLALLPTGALLVEQVYWADTGYLWLLCFLGGLTLSVVLARFFRLTQEWEASGADYSPETRLETAFVGVAIAGLAIVAAPILPFFTSGQVSEAFWRIFEAPYREVEQRLEQSFPGIQGGRSLVPPTGVAAGGLPRAHLLGGRPELGQEVALRIRLRIVQPSAAGAGPGVEQLPVLLLYWRGQTFAHYDGRGWSEQEAGQAGQKESGRLRQSLAAGQQWRTTDAWRSRQPALSSVEVLAASRAVLYAAGEPVSADRPYEAIQRAPGELISLWAEGAPARYTVLGELASAQPEDLRGAGVDYPAQIAALYLELPLDLSPELGVYAAQITEGATTPYDRAVAIEAALRRLDYTLDVPAPPADREIVSWFLFDLKRGYCDYFATSMVVLARLAGIPARLAVGYATGERDTPGGVYVVTELNAHSWPELYFPGYGWTPFEPTAALPAPERPAGVPALPGPPPTAVPEAWEAGLAELQQLATVQAAATARREWAQRLVGALSFLLAVGCAIAYRRLTQERASGGAAGQFEQMARWGVRLGRPQRRADTAREYAAAVAQSAETLAGQAHLHRSGAQAAAAIVRADAPRLACAYEESLYSAPQARLEVPQTPPREHRWRSLWSALRRLWLARLRI